MRMNPEERDALAELAEHAGCSGAEYVRRIIERDRAALAAERSKPAKAPKPKRRSAK